MDFTKIICDGTALFHGVVVMYRLSIFFHPECNVYAYDKYNTSKYVRLIKKT
jgi:hypothetical protein